MQWNAYTASITKKQRNKDEQGVTGTDIHFIKVVSKW